MKPYTVIVESQVNTLVMPREEDPATALERALLEVSCQALAVTSGKPVRLLLHNSSAVQQFNPTSEAK